MKKLRASSIGIAALILALSSIEPLTHVWIACFPPEGAVPTGMHTGDSAIFLHAMASTQTNFHSPFATCHSPDGENSWHYYAPPHFLLYAAVGWIGHALHIPPFFFLGLINGLGGALYLAASYAFLREIAPRHARTAFYCFAFPGGLGGIFYLVCALLGWTQHPEFTSYFERFAHYELIEGQTLSPVLLMPRFYYTAPLAAGVAGLTLFVRAARNGTKGLSIAAGLLFGLTTLFHLRVGPVFGGIALLYLLCVPRGTVRQRLFQAAATILPVAVGGVCFWRLVTLPAAFTQNAALVTGMLLWFIPFLTLTCFHWLLLPRVLRQALAAMPGLVRLAGGALAGYLALYALLYLGYLGYYGNWLRGGDTSAAVAVSDWALLGALPGLWLARKRDLHPIPSFEARESAWLALWFLGLLALALSAFGHGAFLRATPQRLFVLLALPMALLTAQALHTLSTRWRRVLFGVLMTAGICSLSVGALWFQGPLGRVPGKGPFAYLHYEFMTPADQRAIASIPDYQTVLLPSWSPIAFGEILSLRPNLQVLGGPGAMNLSGVFFDNIQNDINIFFNPETNNKDRKSIANRWCVNYVYCPYTCRIDERVLEQLAENDALKKIQTDTNLFLITQ